MTNVTYPSQYTPCEYGTWKLTPDSGTIYSTTRYVSHHAALRIISRAPRIHSRRYAAMLEWVDSEMDHPPPQDDDTDTETEPSNTSESSQLLPTSPCPHPDVSASHLHLRLQELEAQQAQERSTYHAIIAKMASTCRSLQSRVDFLERKRLSNEVNRPLYGHRRCTAPASLFQGQETTSPPTSHARSMSTLSDTDTVPGGGRASLPSPRTGSPVLSTDLKQQLRREAFCSRDFLVYDDSALLLKAFLWF
ncbi:hypothetical protein BC629DRAFT_136134 [Irpex lacteus]|nr:hypothetical protein BC629DRAFT_136134 [Irpex lacteus]